MSHRKHFETKRGSIKQPMQIWVCRKSTWVNWTADSPQQTQAHFVPKLKGIILEPDSALQWTGPPKPAWQCSNLLLCPLIGKTGSESLQTHKNSKHRSNNHGFWLWLVSRAGQDLSNRWSFQPPAKIQVGTPKQWIVPPTATPSLQFDNWQGIWFPEATPPDWTSNYSLAKESCFLEHIIELKL